MQSVIFRFGAFFLALMLMGACGQKGPLYLPVDESKMYSPMVQKNSRNDNNTVDSAPKQSLNKKE
jgi:predicted small lipoprotein YifL|tara:strand:- start:153 stop:347 length:195 start_codon:yes stop_codon:yes gene_type:complete